MSGGLAMVSMSLSQCPRSTSEYDKKSHYSTKRSNKMKDDKHNHPSSRPVTHDLAGWFIMLRLLLDTHFPGFSGVWALTDPLGLGILVGPGRRNDSRGI